MAKEPLMDRNDKWLDRILWITLLGLLVLWTVGWWLQP